MLRLFATAHAVCATHFGLALTLDPGLAPSLDSTAPLTGSNSRANTPIVIHH